MGCALAIAGISLFLVTFYSGSLSLAAFSSRYTRQAISTALHCSFSNNIVRVQLSTPGMTISASMLNNLLITWSNNRELGTIVPPVSFTTQGGVAQAFYKPKEVPNPNDVIHASFAGGFARRNFNWFVPGYPMMNLYGPSSCQVSTSGFTVDPTPSPVYKKY